MKIYEGDKLILDIQVDDSSYRYRAIKGENNLTLNFSLCEHVEIPVGSTCVFQNETYALESPENIKMIHSRNYEYTVVMESPQARLSQYKFRNTVDRRLKFSLTAKPVEHLQMLVDNLNARESGWSAGDCIEATEKVISYNHSYCIEALTQMSETFETEYEIVGKVISLKKIEYNKDNPLILSYGRGNGFRSGVGRTNSTESGAVEILFVQGGTRNIDASKYGNAELLLPRGKTLKYDGCHFEDEEGFDETKSRIYVADTDGYSVRRQDKELHTLTEDSLDCSDIYPHRDETILKVIEVDKDKNWYDVVTDAPKNLDYSKYGIGGENPTIVFQSGELSGREFDLETDSDGNIVTERYYDGAFLGWRFQIVPQEIDGITMPGESFIPKQGDKFRIFGIQLPDEYISNEETKSGAEWEMFREAVKYLYDHEEQKFTFAGELDGIWAKKNWLNVGGKIRLGGFVSFSAKFQPDPVLIRIVGIKEYINNPYSPEIELSNETVGASVMSEIKKQGSSEVLNEERYEKAMTFTRRRFRDAKETMNMLQSAMLNFTDGISPVTVQTMMMLVGDESLQFRFVSDKSNPEQVNHTEEYNPKTKVLHMDAGIIQHMTLGISSLAKQHSSSEYMFWDMKAFDSPALVDPVKRYYVYAKVGRSSGMGTFIMSETAIQMESVSGYYHLLLGILNSENEGERSYVALYGFSEILPGRITTDKIVSADGKTYFDLVKSEIVGRINFLDGLISGLIGVVNESEPDKILAGLNGSDTGKDAEHGKIVAFYGNAGAAADIGSAKTRIYEDGQLYTNSAKVKGRADLTMGSIDSLHYGNKLGIIGGLLHVDAAGEEIGRSETQMENGFFNHIRKDYAGREMQVSISANSDSILSSIIRDIDNNIIYTTMERKIPKGFVVRLENNRTDQISEYDAALEIIAKGAGAQYMQAIRCSAGLFAGLRPMIRTMTKSGGLTKYDHTILVDTTSSITIGLDIVDLEAGQTFDIFISNASVKHTIASLITPIHSPNANIWSADSISVDAYGLIRVICAKSRNDNLCWWLYRLA